MLCPLLEEIWINDIIMEKMDEFFVRYKKGLIVDLIIEMRAFFDEVWRTAYVTRGFYIARGFEYEDQSGEFIKFAGGVINNYRSIVMRKFEQGEPDALSIT